MTWSTVQRQDRVVRPYFESIPITSTKGTSANTATLKNVLSSIDISSAYTSETQISAGSVARISGFRTIAFKGVDAALTTLVITVRIVGTTMWGKQVTETLTLNTGNSWFAETSYAYTGKPSIYVTTTNAAASDLLHAACAKYGALFNGKSTDIYSIGKVAFSGRSNGPLHVALPAYTAKVTSAASANIVVDLDISSAYTSATAIGAGSITAIAGWRTIKAIATDASGTTLTVAVTITGTTNLGTTQTETLTLNTGNSFTAETSYAYTGKPTITVLTTNAAASDLLDLMTSKFGVPANTGASADLLNVTKNTLSVGAGPALVSTIANMAVGTDVIWNDTYKTLDTDDETISAGMTTFNLYFAQSNAVATTTDLAVGTDVIFSDTYKTLDTDDETINVGDELVLTGYQRGLRTPFQ